MATATDRYAALPLQLHCRAVNKVADHAAARRQMQDTIARCARMVRASRAFAATFSGAEVRLVVLPEYFLSGFPMGESVEAWQALACIEPGGPEYEALGRLAAGAGVYLSGNVYEIDPAFPQLYFQVSFLIDDGGEVILRYRRLISMFAATPHDVLDAFLDRYGAEALFPVAATPLGKLACVASEEILYPEISRALALRGAEVLLHSSSEVCSPQLSPKNIAKRARAFENLACVVSANSAGISGTAIPAQSTDGHSQVVDHTGRVLAEAGPGESMNGCATLDLGALRAARATPAMTNSLARQRLELFAGTYGGEAVYPANSLLDEGEVSVPEREHFLATQRRAIEALQRRGVL